LKNINKNSNNLNCYIKLLPLLIFISIFSIYPSFYAINLSFKEYKLVLPPPYGYVGFSNYLNLFKDSYFIQSFFNTIWFAIACVLFVTILGFFTAILLNNTFRGVNILRTAIFLPWTVPYVTTGILWKLFFMSGWGYLTKIINTFGLLEAGTSIAWLSNDFVAKFAIVLAQVWHEFPLATIFFLSGLQTIPEELYEAIDLESRSVFHKLRFITIPLLKPVFAIVIILNTILAITTFDVVYVITGGGPAGKTSLLSYYAHSKAFRFLDFGEGSAISMVLTAVTIIVVIIVFKITAERNQMGETN